jgi:hypothetical protein
MVYGESKREVTLPRDLQIGNRFDPHPDTERLCMPINLCLDAQVLPVINTDAINAAAALGPNGRDVVDTKVTG